MPCNYKDYPNNWKEIRKEILERANDHCELCNAENGKPHWKTGSKVVLTIAHIDQDKENNEKYNLLALCQRCHLRIDLPYKIKKRKEKMKTTITGPICKKQWYLDNREKCLKKSKQWRKDNLEKSNEIQRQYRKDHPEIMRDASLKHRYNLSREDWLKTWESQDGKCLICKKPFTKSSEACVDHDHLTNEVRGLLCDKCNRGLGCFHDDPELTAKATQYLLGE